jgi:hypothetical protein
MISAYDRFFGGPESVGLGRLARGREGSGLLPFVVVVPVPPVLGPAALDFSFEVLVSTAGRGFEDCLSPKLLRARSVGRADGFGGLPFGRVDFSGIDSLRATFTPAGRSSSSAFRLGNVALGLDTGFGDGDGDAFSPVMDASKSRI